MTNVLGPTESNPSQESFSIIVSNKSMNRKNDIGPKTLTLYDLMKYAHDGWSYMGCRKFIRIFYANIYLFIFLLSFIAHTHNFVFLTIANRKPHGNRWIVRAKHIVRIASDFGICYSPARPTEYVHTPYTIYKKEKKEGAGSVYNFQVTFSR